MTRMAAAVGPTHTSPASPQASARAGFSERKPYPGCSASAPATLSRRDECVDVEIGLGQGAPGEWYGGVGLTDVRGVGVIGRIDGHGLEAGIVRAPDDPTGDLAPVGHQDSPQRRLRHQ